MTRVKIERDGRLVVDGVRIEGMTAEELRELLTELEDEARELKRARAAVMHRIEQMRR